MHFAMIAVAIFNIIPPTVPLACYLYPAYSIINTVFYAKPEFHGASMSGGIEVRKYLKFPPRKRQRAPQSEYKNNQN
jgi:hypothetical protein